ncbi:MAG: hypothetical protein KGJ79_07565 [Alphaproteobacteria bacterium]|nr:hypothetical protein [Alphaproteobacteria bacterium]MDE2110984.1 hypothetical protein [Alphaproteobacteria bacterium]
MRDYYNNAKQVTAIHNEAVRRLVDCDETNALELAELFEDAANHYLDISEKIRTRFISEEIRALIPLGLQATARSSETEPSEATTED